MAATAPEDPGAARRLRSHWAAEWSSSPFFSVGRTVVYKEQHQVIFSSHADIIFVVDIYTSSILARLGAFGDPVVSFTVSSDASVVLAVCRSTLIRSWKLDWTALHRLRAEGQTPPSLSRVFSNGDGDNEDAAGVVLVAPLRLWKGPKSQVTCTAFSPQRPLLVAVGTTEGAVYVYDVVGGYCTHVFKEHLSRIGVIRFHPSRLLLFAGSDDGAVFVYDLHRQATIAVLKDHVAAVSDISFIQLAEKSGTSLGGVITGGRDKIVNVWNLDSLDREVSNQLRMKTASSVDVQVGMAPSESETQVLATKESSHKRQRKDNAQENSMWGTVEVQPVQQVGTQEVIESVFCIPTRLMEKCYVGASGAPTPIHDACPWTLVTGGELGIPTFWNPVTRKKLGVLKSPHVGRGAIVSLAQHRSSKGHPFLITVGEDQNIVFWNLQTCHIERVLLGNSTELIHCQFIPVPQAHHPPLCASTTSEAQLPYTRALVLRSDSDCTLMEMSQERTSASLLRGHVDTVLCGDVSPDGCWIVTGSKDHNVRVWSSRMECTVALLQGHTSPVVAVQANKKLSKSIDCSCLCEGPGTTTLALPVDVTSGGFFVVSVCLESVLKVWSVDRNPLRQRCCQRSDAALSNDVNVLPLSVEESEDIVMVDKSIASVVAHEKETHALSIAPNDKLIATGSADKTIKVWSMPELQLLGVCRGHTRAIWTLKFSPTEKVLASGSADQFIKIWNLSDFTCLKTFQGHGGSVLSIGFLNLGTQLVSAGSDGLLKCWNIRTSDCCGSFDAHNSKKVWSVDVDRAGLRALSCGADNQLVIWRDNTANAEREALEKQQQEAAQAFAIQSLSREGKTVEALTLSLRLRRPHQIRQLLQKSFEQCTFDELDKEAAKYSAQESISQILAQRRAAERIGIVSQAELEHWMTGLDDALLKTLVEFIVKWNTNGQTSSVANFLMELLLKTLPPNRLLRIEGFPNLAKAFLAYSSRHAARLGALLQRTFILDMILFTSGVKSIHDVPDLPPLQETPLQHEALVPALSLHDVCDVIFG